MRFARAAAGLAAVGLLVPGVWALGWPVSFAAWIDFPPYNEHLLHDLGAFQIGLGTALLLAVVVDDALVVALAGFVVGGGLHAVNHLVDLDLGGRGSDVWALAALVVVAAGGLWVRLSDLRRPS